ncbi:MAG: family 43 glycosylhydrolase [Eubacteriales bacterium]|nr:family 43 glycosylhydrolase [Eubacteriales bacterium]
MRQNYIVSYTREPLEDSIYSEKLAYSMHLAILDETGAHTPLNHNAGILYAKAVQRGEDGVLEAKSLLRPWLFVQADGSFGVLAIRVEPDGLSDRSSDGSVLCFTSRDLIRYEEVGLLSLGCDVAIEEIVCRYEREQGYYRLQWKEKNGTCWQALADSVGNNTNVRERRQIADVWDGFSESRVTELPQEITGAVPCSRIPIADETARKLRIKFLPPINTANLVPEEVRVSSVEELEKIKAVALYSDGTQVEKRVNWNWKGVDFTKSGVYEVSGLVQQNRYEFPVAWYRADPCIGRWNGKYYFIATNDKDDNHSLYIREADSIPELMTAQEVKILDTETYPHLGNLLWAPEFHIIRGRLYIFHAGTPKEFEKEQCHVMALREGGNPMRARDWEMPVRVIRKDGSMLYGEQGITLDMTEFEVNGHVYAVWSQRQFVPVDQGAWLYIAELDPQKPWQLQSDPVLLSMPEYGWANNHTFVDEGPFAIIREGKIFLTFSSAAVDSTYVVGLLSADLDADLLEPDSWTKENYPLMSSRSREGEFGTGHNSYIEDEDGLLWNAYHARPGVEGPRSAGLRRVHFGSDGYPVLDLTEERDLVPELAWVQTKVIVEK